MTADAVLPDSNAGRRAAWLLDHLGVGGWTGPAGDRFADGPAGAFVDGGEERVRHLAEQLAGCRVTAASVDATGCDLVLHSGRLRRSTLRIEVEDGPPHRIRDTELARTLPEGMVMRPATPEDGAELAELCRQTPIVLGDKRLVIDPGEDYWTATRLMDGCAALVALYEGRIVAVQLATMFEARFGGRHQMVAIVLHTRVHPDFAQSGVRSAIQRTMVQMPGRAPDETDGPGGTDSGTPRSEPLELTGISYVSSENATALTARARQATWACKPYRVVLPCPMDGIAPSGRTATPEDAARIVTLINEGHRDEELFLEYSEAKLRSRLSRAPDLYSWDDVLIGEGAVVGTWFAHQRRTLTDASGVASTSIRAVVADHGMLPGHEEELLGLLATAAAKAAARGITHLSIFSSDGSRGSAALRSAAESIEQYEVVNPFHPEPPGTVERGLWVDQLHF